MIPFNFPDMNRDAIDYFNPDRGIRNYGGEPAGTRPTGVKPSEWDSTRRCPIKIGTTAGYDSLVARVETIANRMTLALRAQRRTEARMRLAHEEGDEMAVECFKHLSKVQSRVQAKLMRMYGELAR